MSHLLDIKTTAGETFTYGESAAMARSIFRRFGNDPEAATGAWNRLMGVNIETPVFIRLMAYESPHQLMNGVRVSRVENTIFVPLPKEYWRSCGTCRCDHCDGAEGFWDTLAVPAGKPDRIDTTWTVHGPEFHK